MARSYSAAAVIATLKANKGQFIDDHGHGVKEYSTAGWFGVYTNGTREFAFIGYLNQYFCINQAYVDDYDNVHLSASSVGGVVRTDLFELADAVTNFNEDQIHNTFYKDARITEFHTLTQSTILNQPSEEDATMNTITTATLKTILADVINTPVVDGVVVTFGTETLAQMHGIVDAMIAATGYDESKLTQEHYLKAQINARQFTKRDLTGLVVNNEVQPLTAEQYDVVLGALKLITAEDDSVFERIVVAQLVVDLLEANGSVQLPADYVAEMMQHDVQQTIEQKIVQATEVIKAARVVEPKSDAHKVLLETYNSNRITEVAFDPSWNNGTGYFDHLASADLGLEIGTRFKSITPDGQGRKIIGVVTPVGNVVFFERHGAGGKSGVVVLNLPRALAGLYSTGVQQASVIEQAVGGAEGYNTNIGDVLDNVARLSKKLHTV